MTLSDHDSPDTHPPAASVDEIIALYERWGVEEYDETLSQLSHSLQTAALAVQAGASDDLVIAALLHDVGHLLDLAAAEDHWIPSDIDLNHESVGARYLARLFPPTVTAPIALHVRAKRYRIAIEPSYLDGLSDGSRASLITQGGQLSPDEVERFEAHPHFAATMSLREWDDGGKLDDEQPPGIETYRDRLEQVALAHQALDNARHSSR